MKNSFKILLGLFLVIFAISCSEDDGTTMAVLEKQDVVFDITNVVQQVASKDAFVLGKENVEGNDSIPKCSDLVPTHVNLVLESPGGAAELAFTLQLVTLNDKTETEVLKLAPGDYKLTEFVVYSGTTAIWASPAEGSYYDLLWPQFNFTNIPFTVSAFDKVKVKVDVLCYEPYKYQEFGFAWFAYSKIEVHTICFFGDICTKYFEEFHNEGSPYFGQDYDGYDFPAIFSIVVKDGQGNVVNDPQKNSNAGWHGVGSPLCIEYPDRVGVEESFTFEIHLAMPDGTSVIVYTGSFADTASSDTGDVEGFGGADGIFDFVVGNCSYDGNDANIELPAYMHIPKTGNMCISGTGTYDFYMTFGSLVPGPISPDFDLNVAYRALCGDETTTINLGQCYDVTFYSSLNLGGGMPSAYAGYPWGSLNWLANQPAPVTDAEWEALQKAIWYVIDPVNTVLGENSALAQAAIANAGFVPSVGDFAFVLIDPNNEETVAQLLIKAIDP
ncbi:MAG: hypothetical protein PHW92_06110 [Lutibacter sp.]|nr:hypothetical protein [Lutibacter sp.]